MLGVTITNTADTVCPLDENLIIGQEYENKVKCTESGVVYAFSQNTAKDAWVFNGWAEIDSEVLLESLTVDEINKAVLKSVTIGIQAEIRGKTSGTGGVKIQLANLENLCAKLAAGEIDIDEFNELRAAM